MGKFYLYINQYATTTFLSPNTVLGANAPVTQYFADELADEGIMLVAANVGLVIYDKHGNSIQSVATYITYTIASPTRVDVYIEATIVGGTGKFAGATGQYTIKGYSDRNSLDEPSVDLLTYDGVIIY